MTILRTIEPKEVVSVELLEKLKARDEARAERAIEAFEKKQRTKKKTA